MPVKLPVPVPVSSPVPSPVEARTKTAPSTNGSAMTDALTMALSTRIEPEVDSAPSAAPKERSPVQRVAQQTRDIRAWLSSQPAEPTKKHFLNTTETFRREHKGTYHAEDPVVPQKAPALSCGEIIDAQLKEALKIASKYGATF